MEKKKNTEDKILKLLFASKGDLLDDEELINTLEKSKNEGDEIREKIN
jgi:dynein heavy chain